MDGASDPQMSRVKRFCLVWLVGRGSLKVEGGILQSERGNDWIIISGSNYFYFLYGNVIYSFNLFPKHLDLLSFI